jgi:hypothetical protein
MQSQRIIFTVCCGIAIGATVMVVSLYILYTKVGQDALVTMEGVRNLTDAFLTRHDDFNTIMDYNPLH